MYDCVLFVTVLSITFYFRASISYLMRVTLMYTHRLPLHE